MIISPQSGHRLPAIRNETNFFIATTPSSELLNLSVLREENIKDTLHAYQLSKRCNSLRVMFEANNWGKRGARINAISPGIIITPLANDELTGPRGDFYKNMLKKSPVGRAGTPDEVANVAELLMSHKGAVITGSDILMDGGSTSSYLFGELHEEQK